MYAQSQQHQQLEQQQQARQECLQVPAMSAVSTAAGVPLVAAADVTATEHCAIINKQPQLLLEVLMNREAAMLHQQHCFRICCCK